ncbi:MAG: aminotransferase class III-fold pyridoxal phosphate-dependent enzyme [Kiritimatiellae bacterium]|nr:aminotransferase class III-fold pyridoxal phosphate-dependent enzyme [Kiritimatiellia bacterium]
MKNNSDCFVKVVRSLRDLLGDEYTAAVKSAKSFLDGADTSDFAGAAMDKVDFYPEALRGRLSGLLDKVGTQVIETPLRNTAAGATTEKFRTATKTGAAPLSALGYYRVGEDGRLYLTTKSEHYHAPLGHAFPGYTLVDKARALGIPNATHNNTRGFITRRLEEELVRTANGLGRGDKDGLSAVLARDDLYTLNRVLNLETGSLAVEAALKMILARFCRMQSEMAAPRYEGRTPVILVMGNDDGGLQANYHGTTVLTQMLRGMWPGLHAELEKAQIWKVVPIRPNSREDIDRAFAEYDTGTYKIAGFFHEIVMMNYGGRLLTPEFLTYAHQRCQASDVVTVVDEIQSCMWAPQMYLFREYGLTPSCVAIGKGFPGGEYPASRIIFSADLDVMPQFGALVTNGQEELASLAYLVTMEWAQANAAVTAEMGVYFEGRLREMAAEYPGAISAVDGWRQMTTLCFVDLSQANAFAKELNQRGLDISAQTYKADCPPVVLAKLPLIADQAMIDFVVETMREVLKEQK